MSLFRVNEMRIVRRRLQRNRQRRHAQYAAASAAPKRPFLAVAGLPANLSQSITCLFKGSQFATPIISTRDMEHCVRALGHRIDKLDCLLSWNDDKFDPSLRCLILNLVHYRKSTIGTCSNDKATAVPG